MRSKIKKSVAIIGEGETEWFYFESMRIFHRYTFKVAPDFPSHSDIGHLLKLAERYLEEGYDYVVCLIDMDRIKNNEVERKKAAGLIRARSLLYISMAFSSRSSKEEPLTTIFS